MEQGNLVLLANLYADLGQCDGVSRMMKVIRSRSMKKTPGCSLIDVNSMAREFVSGDDSKPFCEVYIIYLTHWLHITRRQMMISKSHLRTIVSVMDSHG